jgi:hypothetical protein
MGHTDASYPEGLPGEQEPGAARNLCPLGPEARALEFPTRLLGRATRIGATNVKPTVPIVTAGSRSMRQR